MSPNRTRRIEMEKTRLRALPDLQVKHPNPTYLGKKYGVSRTTIYRWLHVLQKQGPEGLKRRIATGRIPKMTPEQMNEFAEIYLQCAGWTYNRIADWIFQRFGIRYDVDNMGRILRKLKLPSTLVKRAQDARTNKAFAEISSPDTL